MKKITQHVGLLTLFAFLFGNHYTMLAQLPPPPSGIYYSVMACQGSTVTLLSPAELYPSDFPNMTPIGWHGPNNFTSNAMNITVPDTNTVGDSEYFFDLITQNGVFVSLDYYVTINARPATPTATSNGPICASSTLSLNTAAVSGASYSWTGPNGFTSSLQNPSIPNASAQSSGTYTVTVTKSGCNSLPGAATAVVNTTNPPTASAAQSFCGSAKVLQLTATGTAIQWFATANSSSALTPNTVLTNGNYYVSQTVNSCVSPRTIVAVVINPVTTHTTTVTACESYTWTSGNGTTYTSSGNYFYETGCHTETLALTINPALQITAQPASTTLCATVGSTANISIATTVPAEVYAWQYRVVTTANPNPSWITIGSANAAVYSNYNSAVLGITRTATLPAVGTQYRVQMTTNCGVITSDNASLAVVAATKGGVIAVPSINVCLGNSITFTLAGHAGTSLQWQSAASATGTFANIPGATGSSYTLVNAQLNAKKSYRVLVTNNCNGTTAFSTVKTITVNPPTVAGTIIGGGAICPGTTTRMSIVGQTGKVQWEYSTDGEHYVSAPKAADGQTSPFSTTSVSNAIASYMIGNLSENVYFRAKVMSGACDVLYATPVQYVLYNEASVGTVSAINSSVCEDSATTLFLTNALGAITWEKSTNYTATTPSWTPIASSNVLTYTTQTLMYDTAYRAKVTIGSCSTVYSNIAYIHVIKKAAVNVITKNITSPSGANAAGALCTNSASKVLSINTESTNNIQWQWSGSSVTSSYTDIVGANSPTYTVTNALPGANYFRVKLTNSCGRESVGTPTIVYYKDCTATKLSAATFDVVAYPNPYQNEFSLHLSTTNESEVTLLVYDITGKQIEKRSLTPTGVNEASIGKQYQAGIYQLVVTQGSQVKTLRIIKQ